VKLEFSALEELSDSATVTILEALLGSSDSMVVAVEQVAVAVLDLEIVASPHDLDQLVTEGHLAKARTAASGH